VSFDPINPRGLVIVSRRAWPFSPATSVMRVTRPADLRVADTCDHSRDRARTRRSRCNICDIVRTTIYLANKSDFTRMNEIYCEYFDALFPARTSVVTETCDRRLPDRN
jgi:enamine deaminase RidA (YjgF/YER057c/UK114 family)